MLLLQFDEDKEDRIDVTGEGEQGEEREFNDIPWMLGDEHEPVVVVVVVVGVIRVEFVSFCDWCCCWFCCCCCCCCGWCWW